VIGPRAGTCGHPDVDGWGCDHRDSLPPDTAIGRPCSSPTATVLTLPLWASGRVVDHLGPLLVLAPVRRGHGPDTVLIVDGTLVPTRDRRMAASSKNYRFSANLQVVIDANTRLTVAVGTPLPGNRNDCRAYAESGVDRHCAGAAVLAYGGYQGTGLILPYRLHRRHGRTHSSAAVRFLVGGTPAPQGWLGVAAQAGRRVAAVAWSSTGRPAVPGWPAHWPGGWPHPLPRRWRPRVGKSALAHRLLTTEGIPWLPTDVVRTVLRRVLPELDAVDQDPVDAARLADIMYPHIEQAAEVCSEEAEQFLIEGFEVSPSYPARLQTALAGTTVRSCFLGHRTFSADDLASYRGPKPQHERQASRAELNEAAAWIRRRSQQLRDECDQEGLRYLDLGALGFQAAMRQARGHLLGPN
jgi:Transposase DDE domain